VGKLKNLCLDYEIPMVAVALQWCLRHPMVSTIIPGVSNPEEALQNLEAVSVEIPDQFWNDLEPLVMDMSDSRFIVEIKDVIE
jgi:D-threo-aldose 1-dehydrogenase